MNPTPKRYLSHQELLGANSEASSKQPNLTQGKNSSPFIQIEPALLMLEFTSIAQGMLSADAMVKRSPVDLIHAGTVHPGHYLVLVGGAVAEVGEALQAGREIGAQDLIDTVWLPNVHPDVLTALRPAHRVTISEQSTILDDALGIIETLTAPAAVSAADIAIKGATIRLLSIRFSDGLHGKGLVLITGKVSDVEAALELIKNALTAKTLLRALAISQIQPDFIRNILGETRFFREL